MNLILMRHGQAIAATSVSQDKKRELSIFGSGVVPRMAELMVDENIVPKLILVSPAKRTQQTVELLLSIFGPVEVKVVKALYLASPMTILETIHTHGGQADPLLVVGHNPGLETTVSNIAGNIVALPAGAVAHAVIIPNQESTVLGVWRPDELMTT
jgi:phosphohistidine phosphatase